MSEQSFVDIDYELDKDNNIRFDSVGMWKDMFDIWILSVNLIQHICHGYI